MIGICPYPFNLLCFVVEQACAVTTGQPSAVLQVGEALSVVSVGTSCLLLLCLKEISTFLETCLLARQGQL